MMMVVATWDEEEEVLGNEHIKWKNSHQQSLKTLCELACAA